MKRKRAPKRVREVSHSLGTFLDKVPDMLPPGQSGVNNNSLLEKIKFKFPKLILLLWE